MAKESWRDIRTDIDVDNVGGAQKKKKRRDITV